jgi:hypothetical protein
LDLIGRRNLAELAHAQGNIVGRVEKLHLGDEGLAVFGQCD